VTITDWRPFLESWSKELIEARAYPGIPPEVVESGWLGFPGATDEQLSVAEARLGVRLPPSYREFLTVSNGWRQTGNFIWRIWSTEEIDWFRVRNADWIDAYANPLSGLGESSYTDEEYLVYGETQDSVRFRVEYLESALEVSDIGDSAIFLLNPQVVTADGEWEAWFFGNWLPGASRYRSFAELMEAEYHSFHERDT
jgi:SMI1 / KNR4 family (SUKH-1)